MNVVQKVLAALGIEVAEERRGRYWARCPYHDDDDDPSWFIRFTRKEERLGQHHCFACESGGGLLDLIVHARKLGEGRAPKEARDAAKAWLKGLGEEPEPEAGPLPDTVRLEVGPLSGRVFTMPREFIREPLLEWVTPARKFAESRGITPEQVERWWLGYAVDGKLAGRVVIPTTKRVGRIVGYMARSFAGARKRYLYPSASDKPDLDVMFGEFFWPTGGEKTRKAEVVVTEGALNAMAVERARPGVHVAALGGRHVRPMHVGKLAAFGLVTILTDPDAAGEAVALELGLALSRHTRTRRVRLPEVRLPNGKLKDANDFGRGELARWLA